MSKIRRAAVGVVVLGAGLASTSGVAMATQSGHGHGHDDSHGGSTSCLNAVDQKSATKGGGFSLASVAGGDNVAVPVNVCHVLNDNHVLNDISVSALDGIIP
ncbi:hypothetical protein [Actinomycetospora sp. TBRC 11914]|uniref:hypothetical protein n=1 Tax=Actinomycetospora sp. TBRC 11914 TaxID=2729387 RepID=UPI00145FC4F1|nr:hypothetical protein [Actinomycetospora sp. TBRC 11914]NMO92575.1 hypothetical protein [Actinomycetospora sp. TBRC 11914]